MPLYGLLTPVTLFDENRKKHYYDKQAEKRWYGPHSFKDGPFRQFFGWVLRMIEFLIFGIGYLKTSNFYINKKINN